MHGYWRSARHPWPCLLFVIPLLVIYEGGMTWLGSQGLSPRRAGMDAWLANLLHGPAFYLDYAPSLLMGLICLSWAILKWDRSPPDALGVWTGIVLESVVYALAMWGLGVVVSSTLGYLSVSTLTVANTGSKALCYMGSGIYEEIVFRLVGFGGLYWLLKLVSGERTALILALLLSATVFAAAHYVGSQGEAWQLQTFVFRALAGCCFGALFHFRGLGIAVGTHSAYNVIIGLVA